MTIESVQLRIAAIRQLGGGARVAPVPQQAASFDQLLRRADLDAQVTESGAPTDLAAYGNGRVPVSALSPVKGAGVRMWAPAAGALEQMLSDAAKDGITIRITDGYRSYDAQVDVARRKGLYRNGGLAAEPGTSNHGWGRSADLDLSPRALEWMKVNAERYGFKNDVAREPWHWTYSPNA